MSPDFVSVIAGKAAAPASAGEAVNDPKRTFRGLFDHLVGDREQPRRDGEAERLGGLEVDDEIKLS
jgi:hypothetical protein